MIKVISCCLFLILEFNEMSLFGLALFFFSKYQVEIVFNLPCINKIQSNDTLESNLKSNSTITLTYYITNLGEGCTYATLATNTLVCYI